MRIKESVAIGPHAVYTAEITSGHTAIVFVNHEPLRVRVCVSEEASMGHAIGAVWLLMNRREREELASHMGGELPDLGARSHDEPARELLDLIREATDTGGGTASH